MTPDGITNVDWKPVHRLALKIANASSAGDVGLSLQHEKQLHSYLKRLLRKYGPLPSIVSTQADYTDHPSKRVRLYKVAFDSARKINDNLNVMLAAWSIVEIYIEELKNRRAAENWLIRLKDALALCPDRYVLKEYHALTESSAKLGSKAQKASLKNNKRNNPGKQKRKLNL